MERIKSERGQKARVGIALKEKQHEEKSEMVENKMRKKSSTFATSTTESSMNVAAR